MKSVQDTIQETIDKMSPNCTKEERLRYTEAIEKMLKGANLADAVGFTSLMIERLYSDGYQLYNSGNYKNAELVFRFLTSLRPDESKYYFSIAAAAHMQKHYDEAITAYMMAFFRNPSDPLPFYHIADCCIKIKNKDLALFALNMTIFQAGEDARYAIIKERAALMWQELQKLEPEKNKKTLNPSV